MEQFERTNNQPENQSFDLQISKDATYYWSATRKWSLFSAIIGLLVSALIALMLFLLLGVSTQSQQPMRPEVGIAVMVYFGWFVLILTMSILMLLFSNHLAHAIRYGHPDDVVRSTQSLLRYFRVAGIFSIIAILVQVVWLFLYMINSN